MEGSNKYGNSLQRHLSSLKLVSRLLGHELHAQGGAKAITLSREEVLEMQTSIDIFIEEASRRGGHSGGSMSSATAVAPETELVPARN